MCDNRICSRDDLVDYDQSKLDRVSTEDIYFAKTKEEVIIKKQADKYNI